MSAPDTPAGSLYLVPNTLDMGTWPADGTPPDIGEVLPVGVLRTAARLEHWVAENARSARALLKRVGAQVPLARPLQAIQIQELPRPPKGGKAAAGAQQQREAMGLLLAPLLDGHDVGLVSEAGLPAVADPGAALVREAHRCGVRVLPLSGPSSLILAVAAGGLNGQSFAFVGYLPTEAAQRAQRLRELETHSQRWQQTQLLIETPYRNAAMLQALLQHLRPTTWLNVSCGLTLERGWTRTLTVAQWRHATVELPAQVPAVFSFLA
ncbi:16S rRNA (cytidine1402-2'-O)-methyltransferase [Sphaerotilus hippei]|uniref:16S rRNA (Cytidine1402-2'-O)-methyltransferase n=1 Tax=Sphaerotilus hippei TaxID=744406 RepID=A0A318H1X9_9BURK|nr:SAM-dependent methyltransferase [Sphaerotilus hippei]PXW97052.1 16S rRNA (cytidine1402-2'-O)-methyltransferase [Sphaerotilus hippei]